MLTAIHRKHLAGHRFGIQEIAHGADPADICGAVRYLLDAEAVTGQMLAVDGGQHLIWQTPDVQVGE